MVFGSVNHRVKILQGQRKRLFRKNVIPRLQRCDRTGCVKMTRQRVDDQIRFQFLVAQQFLIITVCPCSLFRNCLMALRQKVGDGHNPVLFPGLAKPTHMNAVSASPLTQYRNLYDFFAHEIMNELRPIESVEQIMQ